ncbi:MAG: hypothetical protein V4640_07095 [Verrucomicrobiota bacterium]
MKCILALAPLAALGLVACETMNTPISSGSFDPLNAPGSQRDSNAVQAPTFTAGQFVRASMNSTAFFKERPKGDADADKVLARGTSMKVITTSGSYVKVELDSGEIGFVPSVMLEDPNAVAAAPIQGANEFQVYPPLPGASGPIEPLPTFDPSGLPPEGAIPTVIDPDAPAVTAPVPPVTPTTDTFATPPVDVTPEVDVTPAVDVTPVTPPAAEESMPLPPNGEE